LKPKNKILKNFASKRHQSPELHSEKPTES